MKSYKIFQFSSVLLNSKISIVTNRYDRSVRMITCYGHRSMQGLLLSNLITSFYTWLTLLYQVRPCAPKKYFGKTARSKWSQWQKIALGTWIPTDHWARSRIGTGCLEPIQYKSRSFSFSYIFSVPKMGGRVLSGKGKSFPGFTDIRLPGIQEI